MKVTVWLLCLAILSLVASSESVAQASTQSDSTGLPGDNFSLQGALEMFKRAASPEDFEKLINTEDNKVNNLDLNGDGEIDYVRVIDKTDKGAHAFVLQVPVSDKENQDIAVIELEKTGDSTAVVQIVGDEEIYGEQTIVEPGEDEEDADEAEGEDEGKGPALLSLVSSPPARIVVNVWGWPSVRFVYAPRYVAWVSPWRWRVYPAWWRPWRPLAWRVFHPFAFRHRAGFAVVRTHRVLVAHRVYAPHRVTSVTVRTRHHGAVSRHKVTKTTTIRTKSGAVKVKKSKTTTKVRKRR
ncbi:MAG: hypothetical protein AB1428_07505 [Bacteroidota bacterium]